MVKLVNILTLPNALNTAVLEMINMKDVMAHANCTTQYYARILLSTVNAINTTVILLILLEPNATETGVITISMEIAKMTCKDL